MISRTTLGGEWTVSGDSGPVLTHVIARGPIPATVPGTVHTDLLAAGLIDDPYLDDNEALQKWIGLTDWTYRRAFDWVPDGSDRQELVFDGLDTVASVRLNGYEVAATRNMHRSYRIHVTGQLRGGSNELEVAFSSPVRAADAASLSLGYRPHVNHHPYNAIRKMASSFGWDWGIDTASSGIWRPVRLETWSLARIAAVRIQATYDDGHPRATITIDVERSGSGPLTVALEIAGETRTISIPADESTVETIVDVPNAEPWWPVGHGAPILHDARVALLSDSVILDSRSKRVGFRSVDIATPDDADGQAFEIRINGELILIRGANWIPDDAFPHRVDRRRYAERLDQAEFARINLLRVWGGGIYESEDFYDECDERGILIWQDFLFACAAYSEAEALATEVEAEARDAVTRLSTHPSLVVLNGNNENLWGRQDWGWDVLLDGRSWGATYYYDLLPRIVEELAPHVAYTPGSPFSPDRAAPVNDESQGTMHIWDVWNAKDYVNYRDYRPRFVAEFGWQGPPTWSSLVGSVSDDPLTPESPGMLVHQKAAHGNEKLTRGLLPHFRLPDDVEGWHWAMSLNQAIAVRTGIEYFRSLTPRCTGTIMWQLNDDWPVVSWSAVDGNGRPKPLLHAIREAHSERLLTLQPSGDGLDVVLVNDTADHWAGCLNLERLSYAGEVIASQSWNVDVAARDTHRVRLSDQVALPGEPAEEVLVATIEKRRALHFFTDFRESILLDEPPHVRARETSRGWSIEVTSEVLVRDLTLLVDRVDAGATVDRALVTLLPGEIALFEVSGAVGVEPSLFSDQKVLRSANQLVKSALWADAPRDATRA